MKKKRKSPEREKLPEPPNFREGKKVSDHERAAILLFVDDGRTPVGKNGRADWGDTEIERRRRLVAVVCFDSDYDRADDAIQRLKYLGIVDDDAPCNCAKCQAKDAAKEVPPESLNEVLSGFQAFSEKMVAGMPPSGLAQMGCAYCGEMWEVDLSKGQPEIERIAEGHSRKCQKSPIWRELQKMEMLKLALETIYKCTGGGLAMQDIAKLALKALETKPPEKV